MNREPEILDEVLLPERRGMGIARAIPWALERVLTLEDLDALMDSGALTPVANRSSNLSQVRSAHHLLAQLCAEGKSSIEIGLITGYSPGYISGLRNNDPAFRELLTHYSTVREKVYVDALERMKNLGIASLEELQARLEADPGKFKNGELLAISETMLGKGGGTANHGGVGAPNVNISVNFVPADQGAAQDPKTITVEANK